MLAVAPARARDLSLEGRTKLVTQWYRQFLEHTPSAGETQPWIDQLGIRRFEDVAKDFLKTPEAQGKAFRIVASRVLGKFPDHYVKLFLDGAAPRMHVRLDATVLLCQVPDVLGGKPEAPELRIAALHRAVLGREATPVELAGWALLMKHGMSLHFAALELARTDEGLIARAKRSWKEGQGREPDASEVLALVKEMKRGATEEDVITMAMCSDEYAGRLGAQKR